MRMRIRTPSLAGAFDRLNRMTRTPRLFKFRLRNLSWRGGVCLDLKLPKARTHVRLIEASPKKEWFSEPSEKLFLSRQLERRALIESMVRLTVAR